MPSDIACAPKLGKPVFGALECKLGTGAKRSSIYVLPGMKIEVLSQAKKFDSATGELSTNTLHVKLPSGDEGDVQAKCLSWSDPGVSLMPNPKAKNDVSTVKALVKALYKADKGIRKEMYTFMEKRDFAKPAFGSPEYNYMDTLAAASDDYTKMMHNLIYGTSMDSTNMLELEENKWLADWPDAVVDAYAHGLKGKDRDAAAPAEDEIHKRAQVLNFARDRDALKEDEANVDDKVKRVPEAKRDSERKKILDEIAVKRKDLTAKMKEWQKDADKLEKKVKL